jgi:hypothetical protein
MGRRSALLCFVGFALSCSPSATTIPPFSGIWAGGTAAYQASLSLTQVGDSVRGGFTLTRRADSCAVSSQPLVLPLQGDSLTFAFSPAGACAYSSVGFRGSRRGDRMDADVTVDSNVVAIVLERL